MAIQLTSFLNRGATNLSTATKKVRCTMAGIASDGWDGW